MPEEKTERAEHILECEAGPDMTKYTRDLPKLLGETGITEIKVPTAELAVLIDAYENV